MWIYYSASLAAAQVRGPEVTITLPELVNHKEGQQTARLRALEAIVPLDRPFGDMMTISHLPERYQTHLSTNQHDQAQAIQHVRKVLKQDAMEHGVYLAVILSFLVTNLFFAAGGIKHISFPHLIPVFFAWAA